MYPLPLIQQVQRTLHALLMDAESSLDRKHAARNNLSGTEELSRCTTLTYRPLPKTQLLKVFLKQISLAPIVHRILCMFRMSSGNFIAAIQINGSSKACANTVSLCKNDTIYILESWLLSVINGRFSERLKAVFINRSLFDTFTSPA